MYDRICKVCGRKGPEAYGEIDPDNHYGWSTVTGEVFNEATFKWETVTETYCDGCGLRK